MLIVNFVVCLLKESQHGYFTSSSFSLRAFFLFQLKFFLFFVQLLISLFKTVALSSLVLSYFSF